MKDTIKNSNENNVKINKFQTLALSQSQMKRVKGGDDGDIITEDIITQ